MPASKKKRKPRRRVPAKPPPIDPGKVNQAVKWVLSGASLHDIVESIKVTYADEDPGRLILEAMRHFESAADIDSTVVFGWCFEATKDLYRQMVATGDFAGALRAVKQMMEMAHHVPNQQQGPEDDQGQGPQLVGTAEQAPTQTADGPGSGEPVAGGPEPPAVARTVPPEQPA